MTDARQCPKCHLPVPADSPAGICPKCLMAEGFATTIDSHGTPAELPQSGTLFGPYRLGEPLGSGGMGTVYVAEHTESGRRVALKVLNHRLESTQHRQRFLREGRLAASICHPHSVYIYGTDEIDGTPVIAMELADGGTLQERVRRDGPLPVGEAVDVILQIIDGLEAAAAAGVLHRDIKPANCFVDTDGTVKIGDFGLSISTVVRMDTNLTQDGSFLGTPAFASPEQLRGDELDLRSDIYSVGVTLFYLLTGRMPFEAKQMVQLLATVLEQPAPLASEMQPEVPLGLAKIVQRAMAKRSKDRFATYDHLRQALLPYATAAPSPATLGFRVLAYLVDMLVVLAVAALVPILWARDMATWSAHSEALISAEPSHNSVLLTLGAIGVCVQVGYFVLLEGLGGTTPGKWICRLYVVGSQREAPGLLRSMLRSTIFFLPYYLPFWGYYAVDVARHATNFDDTTAWLLELGTLAQFALFVTVRKSNGYAAIHELASGTRVVRGRLHQARPALEASEETIPQAASEQSFGPYQVLGPIAADSGQSFVIAYDARLLRKVWIRTCAADAAPVPKRLRELSRIGRLRWLGGRRMTDASWDAYEAPTGKPLLELSSQPQPWEAVRFWLVDLAEELNAAQKDGSLPDVLTLDRVWITADGRAKLLDFRAPGLPPGGDSVQGAANVARNQPSADVFLKQVAIAALQAKQLTADEAKSRDVSLPLPIAAHTMLNQLGRGGEHRLQLAELRALTQEPAAVSAAKRVGILSACWIVPILFTVIGLTYYRAEKQFLSDHPAAGEMAGYLAYYRSLDEQDPRRKAVKIVVAHQYRGTIEDAKVWKHPGMHDFLDDDDHRRIEDWLQQYPAPTDAEYEAANKTLAPAMTEIRALGSRADDELYSMSQGVFLAAGMISVLVGVVIVPSMLCVLILGNSLLLRALDIAIVTKTGAPASRARAFWRNAVLWFLVLAGLGIVLTMISLGHVRPPLVIVGYLLVRMFIAERGLHERIAGTWLVPR